MIILLEYNIEDGHFELRRNVAVLAKVGKEALSVYPLLNKDVEMEEDRTLRVYPVREEINRIALLKGAMPGNDAEIVLERLFAGNNGYEIGYTIELGKQQYSVCGIVAFSDYSCLFKNNADGLFDNKKFGVAAVSQTAFDVLEDGNLHYTYAWKNHDAALTPEEKNDFADDILDIVKNYGLKDFVRQSDNQAIRFAGEDFGNDRIFMLVFLYRDCHYRVFICRCDAQYDRFGS